MHSRLRRLARPGRDGGIGALRSSADMPVVQVAALLADSRCVRTWRRSLRLGTPARRAAACVALGTRERGRSVLMLACVLRRDRDEWVRAQAAWTLGMVGGRAAARVVTAVLREETDAGVRAELWRSAARLGVTLSEDDRDAARRAARGSCVAEAAAAVEALRACTDAREAAFLLSLAGHAHAQVRRAVVVALDGWAPAATAWARLAEDPDTSVALLAQAHRRQAVSA